MANTDTITQFLDTINNAGNGNYHNPDYIVNQFFSGDGGGYPLIAVTEHGAPAGPAFHGAQKIKKFFRRLFNAFPDIAFAPLIPGPPLLFLTSADGNTIALQTTIGGHHQDWWFPLADQDNYHSLPLSNIPPNDGVISIPACQVFTFVGQNKIQQLAFYMDRYHFITNLGPPTF